MNEEAFRKVRSDLRGFGIRLHIYFLNRKYMAPKNTKLKEGDKVLVEGETAETRNGIDKCEVFSMRGDLLDENAEIWMVA